MKKKTFKIIIQLLSFQPMGVASISCKIEYDNIFKSKFLDFKKKYVLEKWYKMKIFK